MLPLESVSEIPSFLKSTYLYGMIAGKITRLLVFSFIELVLFLPSLSETLAGLIEKLICFVMDDFVGDA